MTDNVNESDVANDLSADTLFDGKLICYQYKTGYRFSIDSILLSHFHSLKEDETVLDLGSGCSVISLILAYRHSSRIKKITGLEIQAELVELGRTNITSNGFDNIVEVTQGDLKEIPKFFPAESFSSVVCNPPFYRATSGRKNSNIQQRVARHQVHAVLDDIVLNISYVVKNRGLVSLIYPAEYMAELIEALGRSRLQPKRIQLVYSYPGTNVQARLVMVQAIKNGGAGAIVDSPFYIYEKKEGKYSVEMQKLYHANE